MPIKRKFKRDNPATCALNFGELEALRTLLDKHVPMPPEDEDDDSSPNTFGSRLRTYLMNQCRAEGIPIKLSSTPRLPSFPKRPAVFKTKAQEQEYNRIFQQVLDQRQEIINNSPDIQGRIQELNNQKRAEEEARQRRIEEDKANSQYWGDINEPDPDEEVQDPPLPEDIMPDNPMSDAQPTPANGECWCSSPLDPEIHSLHQGAQDADQ